MQRNWMIVAALAASVAACGPNTSQQPAATAKATSSAPATSDGVAPGDWPLINRTLAANRYSPLTDINAGNVRNLETSWMFQLGGEFVRGTDRRRRNDVLAEPRPRRRARRRLGRFGLDVLSVAVVSATGLGATAAAAAGGPGSVVQAVERAAAPRRRHAA
jgi:hypothetical protein